MNTLTQAPLQTASPGNHTTHASESLRMELIDLSKRTRRTQHTKNLAVCAFAVALGVLVCASTSNAHDHATSRRSTAEQNTAPAQIDYQIPSAPPGKHPSIMTAPVDTPNVRAADLIVSGPPARTGRIIYGGRINADAGQCRWNKFDERPAEMTRWPHSFKHLAHLGDEDSVPNTSLERYSSSIGRGWPKTKKRIRNSGLSDTAPDPPDIAVVPREKAK